MKKHSGFIRALRRVASLALVGAGVSLGASALAASFADTYNSCNGANYNIAGQEPDTAGQYPVFVYLVATNESYDNASAAAAVSGMVSRGFVAATVQYSNGMPINCSGQSGKAQCIFDQNNANSAISKLCARGKADCSKGIVLGGLSQGAITAVLAKNVNPNVRAVYGMGILTKYQMTDMSSCLAPNNRSLPADKLRAVNGEADEYGGGFGFCFGTFCTRQVRTNSQNVTGLSCGSSAYSCYRANGSGWHMVKNSEVNDNQADHCYIRASGGCMFGSQNNVDTHWTGNSGAAWTLEKNLDWLQTQVSP